MNVTRWKSPAVYFPWQHVQRYIDSIDSAVYRCAIDFAREQHGEHARACPECGREPSALFWCSVSSPEEDWDEGRGLVGFLTLCDSCKAQVDFFIDKELTDMQAEQWRTHRVLF